MAAMGMVSDEMNRQHRRLENREFCWLREIDVFERLAFIQQMGRVCCTVGTKVPLDIVVIAVTIVLAWYMTFYKRFLKRDDGF
eukprot:scaffold847_cov172-Ochromonas_danica.AAC.20